MDSEQSGNETMKHLRPEKQPQNIAAPLMCKDL
jgi:hypothetical protein